MTDLKLTNVPSLNVTKMVDLLANSYIKLIKSNEPLKKMPTVMLWGPPGVGKSQGVRQIAKKIEQETNKKVKITDVRLLLFNPIDLRGIPTANQDKTLAVWLKPQIFQMDDSNDVINILFLDEISAAPQSVQAAAYQIALDRVIGEHQLPENCIVMAAGNRITDKSVTFKMPKALANRMLHLEITESFSAWKIWALNHYINEKVIGFLSFNNNYLMEFDASLDDLAFATPRTWEMVSNILNNISDDINVVEDLIAGIIGTGVTIEFRTWCEIYEKLPKVEDIFKGLNPPAPSNLDALYALVTSMVCYARDHKDNLDLINNSIDYLKNLPPDFATMLIKDYMGLEHDYKNKLMKMPSYITWSRKYGAMLNGNK